MALILWDVRTSKRRKSFDPPTGDCLTVHSTSQPLASHLGGCGGRLHNAFHASHDRVTAGSGKQVHQLISVAHSKKIAKNPEAGTPVASRP